MFYYAISDPHGCQDVFQRALEVIDLTGKNHLFLLGDYLAHQPQDMSVQEYMRASAASLMFVRRYQSAHAEHVTVLPGNHELFLLQREELGEIEIAEDLHEWMRGLPAFVETDSQIFVHAGIDEKAGEWWRWGSNAWYFCGKYPADLGPFEKDIIAGHVGAATLADDPEFEGVFWDGQSHYYIDASTERTGRINILRYDTECGTYTQRVICEHDSGDWRDVLKPEL